MTLLDVPSATSTTDLKEALRVLAASQHDVVGALARLAGPVSAQVQQLAALIAILQQRLEVFESTELATHPALRVPPLDGTTPSRADEIFIASLRRAEQALRDGQRHVPLRDPEHPTITELVRLQTDLVGASLVPLVHVLAELAVGAGQLDHAIAAHGAVDAATVS